jgi:uncharacterized protein
MMQWVRTLTCVGRTWRDSGAPRGVTALFLAFLLLSGTGCAWLDAKQRQIIYRPTPGEPAGFAGLRTGDERYFVDVPQLDASQPAQHVDMWWLPHADKTAPTLLYFHGTFRNLPQNLPKIEALRAAGFAVLAVDYRGWGRSSTITPSEQSILQDADLAWAELVRREPRAAQRVLYGHSMGSGVAVDVASRLRAQVDYGAVILESALTSFKDVASEAGFFAGLVARFSNQYFASLEKIAKVQAPVLMIHGSADNTVPMRVGEKLFAAASAPKQWLPIEGGRHSDLHLAGAAQYQAALQQFKLQYILGR